MENFQYYTPTKVVFGKGAEEQAGELIRQQGCGRVLVHYGSGSVVRSGLLDRICASLDREKILISHSAELCRTRDFPCL